MVGAQVNRTMSMNKEGGEWRKRERALTATARLGGAKTKTKLDVM